LSKARIVNDLFLGNRALEVRNFVRSNANSMVSNSMARTVIERHIKVRGEANPYQPESVEYFEKRRCFAWRTYPVGKTRAIGTRLDRVATQDANNNKQNQPDCRISSAEADLRKA